MNVTVGLINYGMNNINSVKGALESCGASVKVVTKSSDLCNIDKIVLPGVGVFADGMRILHETSLYDALREEVFVKKTMILGVCLGMQLLAEEGDEGGVTKGLGFIPGRVTRLSSFNQREKIPHVGWNEVNIVKKDSVLTQEISSGTDFYFVHSYHLIPKDTSCILGETIYSEKFASIVHQGVVFGTQFHPEKSYPAGHVLLRNFLNL